MSKSPRSKAKVHITQSPLLKSPSSPVTATLPVDSDGRLYHLGLLRGELANHIITVGDTQRAYCVSSLFDAITFTFTSHRGFTTMTGTFKGRPVSVVAIGMGLAMMDFFVREARVILDGPMFIIRLGTCGILSVDAPLGSFLVPSKGCLLIQRDPDYFYNEENKPNEPYRITRVRHPNAALTQKLIKNLKNTKHAVVEGINATADSFYSSQGRRTLPHFDDGNDSLLTKLRVTFPDLVSLEMETFQLIHLADVSRSVQDSPTKKQRTAFHANSIYATAVMIGVAHRIHDSFMTNLEERRVCEEDGARACLETLVEM